MPDSLFDTGLRGEGDHHCYITSMQVRFGHVDPAGIAYFPRIHNFLHEAFENLWGEYIGVPYYHLLMKYNVGFPMVHSDVDFLSPLRFGDRPTIRITCFKLGRSSIGLRYVFEVRGTTCVDARMTTVSVDTRTLKSIPMPQQYREKFERIMAPLPEKRKNDP